MATPLYDSLKKLSDSNPLRLHMPGHKGRTGALEPEDWTALDFTELSPTGDLFSGGDAIAAAEALWAARFGAENCLFLTGGSTQGIHTAVHLCCKPGDTVLVDRSSHRALWNALALVDARLVNLSRPWREEEEIVGPVQPEALETALSAHPEIQAVFLTSPTYYGICSSISELARICHSHGAKLIVDSAHGAHFPFLGLNNPAAQGADVTVVSAHKTLPAPGQSALLFTNGISPAAVRRSASVYGSSSPSYAMMAALDRVRAQLEEEENYLHLTQTWLPAFCQRLEEQTSFRCLRPGTGVEMDPARLVISTRDAGLTGSQVAQLLEEQGIYCEMSDYSHLVCILTCADRPADLERLLAALITLNRQGSLPPLPPPPEPGPHRCSLREAMFSPQREEDLSRCVGQVAAGQIAPYPPGIPIVAPGEEITKKHLAYLAKIGYNEKVVIIPL